MTLKLRIWQVICCFSVLNHYQISLHHCKHACTSPVCLCSCRLLQATVHWLFSLGFSNFMAVLLIECTFYTHIRLTHFSVTLYAVQLWQSLETTFRVRETIWKPASVWKTLASSAKSTWNRKNYVSWGWMAYQIVGITQRWKRIDLKVIILDTKIENYPIIICHVDFIQFTIQFAITTTKNNRLL